MNWFRYYHEALDDPKVQRLPPVLFKHWVNLLCLANQNTPRGSLPVVDDVAFRLRLTVSQARKVLDDLAAAGLVDAGSAGMTMHNWNGRQRASDDVAERVKRHRRNEPVTLQETLPVTPRKLSRASETETETETDTESSSSLPPEYASERTRDDADDDDFSPSYPTTMGKSWEIAVKSLSDLFPELVPSRVEAMLGDVERDVGPLSKPQLQNGFAAAFESLKRSNGSVVHVRPYVRKVLTERLREVANVRQ